MAVRRYQDLIAWQTGELFKEEVFRLVAESAGANQDFKYRSQILEAARGITSHIVEGFLRCSPREFCRFLDYAVSSLGEAESRLRDGVRLGYFPSTECSEAFRFARRCFTATIRLKKSQARFSK